MRRAALVAMLAACGGDDGAVDVSCMPVPVYLNRDGGTFRNGDHDDAINNLSVVIDTERTLAPWPHDDASWREVVGCIRGALGPLPRLSVTETDPGSVPHVELVFTDRVWDGAGTTYAVPGSCRPGHQVQFVFGDAVATSARACHVAMLGFAQMTAQLSLGADCRDFVNNAQDCAPTRAFLAQDVSCVDGFNQPTTCRCGGTTQNTLAALTDVYPACP